MRTNKKTAKFILTVMLLCSLCLTVAAGPLPASAENDPLIVMLDPGHGGTDPGAVRTEGNVSYYESTYNMKIMQACREELSLYDGVKIYVTRGGDTQISTFARSTYAKRVNADLFVSFHINASTQKSDNGSCVIVPCGNYRPEIRTKCVPLANRILERITAMGLKNCGLMTRKIQDNRNLFYPDGSNGDYYEVVRMGVNYGIPSIIIEHAFISNDNDFKIINNDAFLTELGKATASAIAAQYGLQKTGHTLEQPVLKSQMVGVSMNTVPKSMTVGGSATALTASGGEGTGEYIFYCSNQHIIRIVDGKAYPIGSGTAKLSVTRYEDEHYTPRSAANQEVTVSPLTTKLRLSISDNYRSDNGKQNVVLTCVPEKTAPYAIPTGMVTFFCEGKEIGKATFREDGKCNFTVQNLEAHSYGFTASYESGFFDGFVMQNTASASYQVAVTTPTPIPPPTPIPTPMPSGNEIADYTFSAFPPATKTAESLREQLHGFMSDSMIRILLAALAAVICLTVILILVFIIKRKRDNQDSGEE